MMMLCACASSRGSYLVHVERDVQVGGRAEKVVVVVRVAGGAEEELGARGQRWRLARTAGGGAASFGPSTGGGAGAGLRPSMRMPTRPSGSTVTVMLRMVSDGQVAPLKSAPPARSAESPQSVEPLSVLPTYRCEPCSTAVKPSKAKRCRNLSSEKPGTGTRR